jgi:hypothetical protein
MKSNFGQPSSETIKLLLVLMRKTSLPRILEKKKSDQLQLITNEKNV